MAASSPTWGAALVGGIPMFEYLADEQVDSIGFVLRTASLMSDAEPYFDDTNISPPNVRSAIPHLAEQCVLTGAGRTPVDRRTVPRCG